MSQRALSKEAMLASLQDIELPVQAAGGLVADIAVAVALGALAALVLALPVRLFSLRRPAAAQVGLAAHLAHARSLPEPDRRVALLHLLRAHAPERYPDLARDLYDPRRPVASAEIEAELHRRV